MGIYFDAQLTSAREPSVRAAIAAGKHVYAEKPLAETLPAALELAGLARDAGIVTASSTTSCSCPACGSCGG